MQGCRGFEAILAVTEAEGEKPGTQVHHRGHTADIHTLTFIPTDTEVSTTQIFLLRIANCANHCPAMLAFCSFTSFTLFYKLGSVTTMPGRFTGVSEYNTHK